MLILLATVQAFLGTYEPVRPPMQAPAHYKIVSKTTSELDLSAMGAPSQSVVISVSAWVSVTLSDTTGGKLAHVVVDSSSFDAGAITAAMPPEMTASSQGSVFHVYLVNGKPHGPMLPTTPNMQAVQLVPGLELLLAGTRPTRAAETWIDSSKADTTVESVGAAVTRVTNWTAKAGAGGKLEVDGTWKGTTTVGSAGPMQMEMQMSGTTHVSGVPGLLSEGSSTGTGQANMNIGGNAIPMKVTMDVKTTAVP